MYIVIHCIEKGLQDIFVGYSMQHEHFKAIQEPPVVLQG